MSMMRRIAIVFSATEAALTQVKSATIRAIYSVREDRVPIWKLIIAKADSAPNRSIAARIPVQYLPLAFEEVLA